MVVSRCTYDDIGAAGARAAQGHLMVPALKVPEHCPLAHSHRPGSTQHCVLLHTRNAVAIAASHSYVPVPVLTAA